jgi:hypothetical protein
MRKMAVCLRNRRLPMTEGVPLVTQYAVDVKNAISHSYSGDIKMCLGWSSAFPLLRINYGIVKFKCRKSTPTQKPEDGQGNWPKHVAQ